MLFSTSVSASTNITQSVKNNELIVSKKQHRFSGRPWYNYCSTGHESAEAYLSYGKFIFNVLDQLHTTTSIYVCTVIIRSKRTVR